MSNYILEEIHNYITHRIDLLIREKNEAQDRGDALRSVFLDGSLTELKEIRNFLSHHFDLITQKYYWWWAIIETPWYLRAKHVLQLLIWYISIHQHTIGKCTKSTMRWQNWWKSQTIYSWQDRRIMWHRKLYIQEFRTKVTSPVTKKIES